MEFDAQTFAISNLLTLAIFLGGGAGYLLSVLLKKQAHKAPDGISFNQQQEMITHAQEEANRILEESATTSANIIQTTQQTNEHITENLDRILQSIAQQHIEVLKSDSEKFKSEFEKQLKTVNEQFGQNAISLTQTTETAIAQNMQKFTESLVTKATQSEEMIDKKTQELLAQVELDLGEYKKARMEKLDQKIEQLVEKTYQQVLRRSIPDALHKELILESLEKAKTEGVLNL